jgi:hypothetical protein
LGEVALLRGNRQQAGAYLNAAERMNFRSIGAHYLGGYLKWLDGEFDVAHGYLNRAVDISQGSVISHSASSEGQTKKGAQPLLAGGARYATLFPSQWSRLARWPRRPVTMAETKEEYGRLQEVVSTFRATHVKSDAIASERGG